VSTNRPKPGFELEADVDEAVLEADGVPDSVLTHPRNVSEKASRNE
jgi:hypothetical protein